MINKTLFMHYRNYSNNGEISSLGGATLAIRVKDGAALVGTAFCHPNDPFNKKLGRTIAEGRINAYPKRFDEEAVWVFELPSNDVSDEGIKSQIHQIVGYKMTEHGLA